VYEDRVKGKAATLARDPLTPVSKQNGGLNKPIFGSMRQRQRTPDTHPVIPVLGPTASPLGAITHHPREIRVRASSLIRHFDSKPSRRKFANKPECLDKVPASRQLWVTVGLGTLRLGLWGGTLASSLVEAGGQHALGRCGHFAKSRTPTTGGEKV
jgi:hypothetical protein